MNKATELMQYIEELARAWASIDGKSKEFDACKADSSVEADLGHYGGYISEAGELLRRSPLSLHKLLQKDKREPTKPYVLCVKNGVTTWSDGTCSQDISTFQAAPSAWENSGNIQADTDQKS